MEGNEYYGLPESLMVNGVERAIRPDFRNILRIIIAMKDPELDDREKIYVCLDILYEDFKDIDAEDYEAAFNAATWFINCGDESRSKSKVKKATVDFEQDERLIMAAVNRVAGKELRELEYLHWWTFMGYFMEIGECTYSYILQLRSKRNKGKALENSEKEFWDNNRDICVIREKYTEEELEDQEFIKNAFK